MATSLRLNNLTSRVTTLHNAVSEKRELVSVLMRSDGSVGHSKTVSSHRDNSGLQSEGSTQDDTDTQPERLSVRNTNSKNQQQSSNREKTNPQWSAQDNIDTQPERLSDKDNMDTQPERSSAQDNIDTQPKRLSAKENADTRPERSPVKDNILTQPERSSAQDNIDTQPKTSSSKKNTNTRPERSPVEDNILTQPERSSSQDNIDTQPERLLTQDKHVTRQKRSLSQDSTSTQRWSTQSEVQAVVMDDLIPHVRTRRVFLKIDIQGSETRALRHADRFFRDVEVVCVLLEWRHVKLREKERDFIIGFMSKHGYQAYSVPTTSTPLPVSKNLSWPHNVYWRRPK
ncbi:hypothetical protein BaRGS_00019862 [Batillaria attramentaria]|uniref:Methyltransferase FkbM domain-containing protein n=1 Tax=Batillaria attramentaria TaxID=370345 RepID=A0ABD0KQB8_9CAEN